VTATINHCKFCGEESDSEQDICKVCNTIQGMRETKDCPFCKKRVELTKVEDHSEYKLKFYNCGHSFKLVTRSIVEPSIKVSDRVSWYKKKNSVATITKFINSKDYSEAISRACTYFQYQGKKILLWHSKQSGTQVSKSTLKRLEFIVTELYARQLIDKDIHDKMNGIKNNNKIVTKGLRNFRNEYEHEDRPYNYSSDQAQKDEAMANTALYCVKSLVAKYGTLT
jgi:hypothetical protein